jgi:hypothetical protein
MYFASLVGARKVPAYRPVNLPAPLVDTPATHPAEAPAGT